MAVHQDVSRALQEAATRRHQETRLRKEEQSQRLGAHYYHCLQKKLNKKKFLTPLDADTTQASIFYIKKRFMRCVTYSYPIGMQTSHTELTGH